MHHYVALAWPSKDKRAGQLATRIRDALLQSATGSWNDLLSTEGLAVLSRTPVDPGMCTYVLAGGLGVVVGRIFTLDAVARPIRSADLPSTKIVETGGNWLLENCWGKYVAVLRTADGNQSHVLRDCSGHIPCYYLDLDGVFVFFADIRDLECLRIHFTLNERFLTTFIALQPFQTRHTGLNEITRLLAGDCVTLTGKGLLHRSMWNPRGIVASRTLDDYPQARAALVELTERVIAAWALLYRRILLSLSGGLDSAILLGCLKRMGLTDRVVCVTEYTPGTADDERLYARSAARMAGAHLTEVPRICDGQVFVERIQSLPAGPCPDISHTHRILALGALNRLAENFECDTLWTGQGGDQIFLQTHHSYGAVDYLMQHRHPWALPSLAYESALLSGQSIWTVLCQALSFSIKRNVSVPAVMGGCGRRFLRTSSPLGYPPSSHAEPGLAGNERIPPGKLDQLDMFTNLLNRHTPVVGLEHPYEQHPLISQPLIELSLKIPTYYLLRGGRQRAMARDAFADRVPSCILMREDKGGIADQLRSLLRGGAPRIQETLLEGNLVSMGILDRSALEGILRQEETFTRNELMPLFACIAAEAWVRQWKSQSARAVAAG